GLIAALGWAALTYSRYGTFDGADALVRLRGAPFDPVPLDQFVREILRTGWTGARDVEALRWLGTGGIVMSLCVAAVSLLRRPGRGHGPWRPALRARGRVGMMGTGTLPAPPPPLPRALLSAAPPVAALIAGAWTGLLGPRAALIPGAVLTLAAAALRASRDL